MNNQNIKIQSFITFDNLKLHLKGTLSLYIFTLGTGILGYSIYLFISSVNSDQTTYTSWTGETLFWGLIFFLISIFVLFLPIEFSNTYFLKNSSFNDLVINIVSTITTSLIFLILFQILVPNDILILKEITTISRSVSFAGFIIIPISFFILNNLGSRVTFLQKYNFSIILFVWIMSLQVFL